MIQREKPLFSARYRNALAGALALFGLLSCGTNTPKIPPELLNGGGCAAPDYPSGPYGTEEGQTLANACFQGFRNPAKVSHDESSLETIAFSDYYDPTGSRGDRLLLINTAAVWCSACRTEHEGLSAKNDQYSPKGLRILSTLFQDAARNPATIRDLSAWVETFSSDYAMVLDPDYQLGAYASAETAPLNLVVETKTMTIEKKLLGDQPTILWPSIDAALAQP
ncbi:MAG TPA: redoxin domain-containing protein [Polyangiaceae bacterium]|nr:redoxin domain-containing protein [Polyangiaceae bacterium]